ncbi:IS200/IS605 family transposase [Aceticella autotrophica]|uniref:IS200/IS605 family transposase n=1 Tax=Aceticella autotrophica TaxID=2755338 RepID=A0A975AXX1_9THEO|nr:IS200/IS605 family transposase [Aceticella autotrophica]QSZ28413.1 IS200/IS605 family transposase [Aceticella autotrophica]
MTSDLVVVTKYRHKCLTKEILNRLKEIIENLFSKWKCILIEFNGEADHIHILFEAPPQVQLSKLINNLKTVTARLIRKEYSEYLTKFYWKPYLWNRSYLILSSGGAPIEIIKRYIQEQNTPDD